jgi:hypothetical protein
MTKKQIQASGWRIVEWNEPKLEPAGTGGDSKAESFTPSDDLQEERAYNGEEPSEKRRCSELNKKGEPCKAWALKSDPLGRCAAHEGSALKYLDPAKAQRVSAAMQKERNAKAKRSAQEVLAAKLEENAEELVELMLKAARAGEWRAVTAMLDRVFGRPTERVETVETESETTRWLKSMTPEMRLELLRRRGLKAVDDEPQEEMA